MKFVLALIAFAAFANAGVVKNKDAPITAKDIDKLLNDMIKYEDSELKAHEPFQQMRTESLGFQRGDVKGEFSFSDVNLRVGDTEAFSESTSLGENDLSIVIGAMRSGITADGKIQFVGSANGKDFDETGTFSFKWDDVAIVLSTKFLLDEKSMKLDKLSFADLSIDRASISIQGVNIGEMKQVDQEAAVLDSLNEYRHKLVKEYTDHSTELVQFFNSFILHKISPRELYNQLRQAVPNY